MHENETISPTLRIKARLRKLWVRHLVGVNREDAEKYVLANGTLTPAFVFLVITSCSIATLGLLLNSVAVIIGAMLIAPLMGPIILLGFAVAKTDIEYGIRASKALLIGVVTAIVSSYAIVKLSPFIAPTPEILARTQPNLFDLLVAVVSGMAGGYAVIRREVGTVAGVAIATALMPPLATAGYGLASANQAIFDGAFFLFLTNMIAIAFSASGMAVWYGFGNLRARRELLWKTFAGLLVLAVLSVPLLNSLNVTVSRTLTNKKIETILRDEGNKRLWQLGQISTRNDPENVLHIDALVFVPEIDLEATKHLDTMMTEQLGKTVHLDLNQVLIGERKPIPVALPAPVNTAPSELSETEALRRYLKRFLGLPVTVAEIDAATNSLTIQISPAYADEIGALVAAEKALAGNLPKWKVYLIPPQQALPEIHFSHNSARLDKAALATLASIDWALARWNIRSVQIEGAASSDEKSKASLAKERAQQIADVLKKQGITADISARALSREQITEEKEKGRERYRAVTIRPVLPSGGLLAEAVRQ